MAIKIAQIKKFKITFTGLKNKEEIKEASISLNKIPTLILELKFNNSLTSICEINKVFNSTDYESMSNDWLMKVIYCFLDKTDSLNTNDIIDKYIKLDCTEDGCFIEKISHVLEDDWEELDLFV